MNYLALAKIGHPIFILISLIVTVINPTAGAIISGFFLTYLVFNLILGLNNINSAVLSATITLITVKIISIHNSSSLILEINTNYNDQITAILVAIICLSSLTFFHKTFYKKIVIAVLICFTTLNILKTAEVVKAEKNNSEHKISSTIDMTLEKLDKDQLVECISSQKVNNIPCFVFQKRYTLVTEDSNLQGIFNALEMRKVGKYSWSQEVETTSHLLKDTKFTDTDHDVLMARVGVLNDENSVIVMMAPIQNQADIDSMNYISLFGLSLSFLIIAGAISLTRDVERSAALYIVSLAILMSLGLNGITSLASATFVTVTIFSVHLYKKAMLK